MIILDTQQEQASVCSCCFAKYLLHLHLMRKDTTIGAEQLLGDVLFYLILRLKITIIALFKIFSKLINDFPCTTYPSTCALSINHKLSLFS